MARRGHRDLKIDEMKADKSMTNQTHEWSAIPMCVCGFSMYLAGLCLCSVACRPKCTTDPRRCMGGTLQTTLRSSVCEAVRLQDASGRKSAFRAGFRPDCYRENTEIGPPAGRRPAGGPISVPVAAGQNLARKADFRPGSTIAYQKVKRNLKVD